MALIPLLFISISDSLVILVFLRVFDFEKGWTVVSSSPFSENSLPHISVLDTVAKHTQTHTHTSFGCIIEKVCPVLDDEDKQNRSEAAVGRRFLAFYYAAPVWTTNTAREMEEISCFARPTLWKQMSKAWFLLIHPPVCSLHYAALFLLHLHAAPLLCSSVCFHSSKKKKR